MKRIVLAVLVALVPALVTAQPVVELNLYPGGVYVDMAPESPANIFALTVVGDMDFEKGPELPSPDEWTLSKFFYPSGVSVHLYSFTQAAYAGTILTASGCPGTWHNSSYVQSWGMGDDWIADRPTRYGSVSCALKPSSDTWGTIKRLYR